MRRGRGGTDLRSWVRNSFQDNLSPLIATGRLTLDAEFADRDQPEW